MPNDCEQKTAKNGNEMEDQLLELAAARTRFQVYSSRGRALQRAEVPPKLKKKKISNFKFILNCFVLFIFRDCLISGNQVSGAPSAASAAAAIGAECSFRCKSTFN